MTNLLAKSFGADLRSLAALRIGCAALILLDLVQRSGDLVAHYTDYGVVPRTLVMQHSSSRWYVSFHYLSGVWELQALLFAGACLCAAALLVGYRTRLASVLSWALLVSLCARNPYIVQGGDMLLRVVLFWGIFLPWGAVFSVDRAWRGDSNLSTHQYLSWGTAAYAVQIISMYWFTVLLKSGTEWWGAGTAVYYTLSFDQLTTPIGAQLVHLPETALKIATWIVPLFEIVGPLALLWPFGKGRIRLYGTLGFILLHVVFLITLFIGIFPLIGIISTLFFFPSLFWERAEKIFSGAGGGTTIYYDGDCGFCWRTVQILKSFVCPAAKILPAQSAAEINAEMMGQNSWIVFDAEGKKRCGYDAWLALLGSAPIFRPLARIFRFRMVRPLGARIYSYVASHRRAACPGMHEAEQGSDVFTIRRRLRTAGNLGIGLLIAYVLIMNLATLPALGIRIPEKTWSVSNIAGLDQLWNMFAPFPAKDDGWYIVPGELSNGNTVDLFRDGGAVSFSKPVYVSLEYKNHRWRKFMDLLRKRPPLQPVYARYLCREWNRRHGGSATLVQLEIIYMLEWTQPPPDYSPVEKRSVYKFQCSAGS